MEKKEIRKIVFARRKAATDEEVLEKSRMIAKKVRETEAYQKADTVFVYMDYKHEVMTGPIIDMCREDGKTIAAPRVEGKEMTFIRIDSDEQFGPGCMGIREPQYGDSADNIENALIIIPGVAFDKAKHRVGYGGGFYDKYQEMHTQHSTIAVCFEFQLFDEVPFDSYDICPQMVITEKRVL